MLGAVVPQSRQQLPPAIGHGKCKFRRPSIGASSFLARFACNAFQAGNSDPIKAELPTSVVMSGHRTKMVVDKPLVL
eukprot:11159849-Lingulodinium_polyedra.AAC.1